MSIALDHVSNDAILQTPEVHPVLLVFVGSTTAELALALGAELAGRDDLVPHRTVVIDALPYEDLVTRLVQNGFSRAQVEAALPRANYFHLTSPFAPGFEFGHPLNQGWKATIHDAALERIAAQPQVPGCAGTPAMGRARVEGAEVELRNFFERHKQELLQVRVETLALLEGVRAIVVTTFRGGTGTGATQCAAGVLRSTMGPADEIHLRVLMPCIYRGDDRAWANVFAQLREIVGAHRYGARLPFRADKTLPPPFNTVGPVFVTDGSVALSAQDALMQEAAILGGQLRARPQSAYNARHVDLTDVTAHDIDDEPTHVRLQTAATIRTVAPGALEYFVAAALRHGVAGLLSAIDAWEQRGTLSAQETERLDQVVDVIVKDLGLDAATLAARLDPSPAPAGDLRTFFEQLALLLGSMPAETVKEQMAALPDAVRRKFDAFAPTRQEHCMRMARELPDHILEALLDRVGGTPHLLLAALPRLRDRLAGIADEVEKKIEESKQARANYGGAFGEGLQETQQAGRGVFGIFIGRDEVVRDAARKALEAGLLASLARAEQERNEALFLVLKGPLTARDAQGRPAALASATEALASRAVEALATLRTRIESLQSSLRARIEAWGQLIEKRSAVFQRSVVFDGYTTSRLDAEAKTFTERMLANPAATSLVRKALDLLRLHGVDPRDLDAAIRELLPLVPSYGETTRTLTEVLQSDPARRNVVVQLLRNRMRPFAPIDREIEDQQGLRNRRDNLLLVEVPGGKDGFVGALLLREGIATNPNTIVDAGEDEIRLHYVRDGLPWAVLRPVAEYRRRHDQYMQNPAAVHPYTRAGWALLPALEPSRTNLRHAVEGLLAVVKAAVPARLQVVPSGGFILRYDKTTPNGFDVAATESFPNSEALIHWVARHVAVRKQLDAVRRAALDADPDAFKAALLTAWRTAAGSERLHLEEALYALRINPALAPVPSATALPPGGAP